MASLVALGVVTLSASLLTSVELTIVVLASETVALSALSAAALIISEGVAVDIRTELVMVAEPTASVALATKPLALPVEGTLWMVVGADIGERPVR